MATPSVQQNDRPAGGTVKGLVDRLSKDLTAKPPGPDVVSFRKPLQSTPINTNTSTSIHPPSGAGSIAIVRFSYAASHEDELNLAVDDRIEVMEETEEGWMKGRLSGRVGVFPTNFVAFVTDSFIPSSTVANTEEKPKNGTSIDNNGDGAPEASQRERNSANNAVSSIGARSAGSGSRYRPLPTGAVHTMPAELTSSSSKKSAMITSQQQHPTATSAGENHETPMKAKEYARVLYQYTAAHEDELSLPVGALVTVLKTECDDAGWFYGQLDGKKGVFPDNFVQLIGCDVLPIGNNNTPASAVSIPAPASPPQQPTHPAPPQPTTTASVPLSQPPPTSTVAPMQTAAPPLPKPPIKPSSSVKPSLVSTTGGFDAARSAISAGLKIGPPGSAQANVTTRLTRPVTMAATDASRYENAAAIIGRTGSETSTAGSEDGGVTAAGDQPSADRLQHLNLNRPKQQNKRPPSQLFFKEMKEKSIDEGDSPTNPTKTVNDHGDIVLPPSFASLKHFTALVPPASAFHSTAGSTTQPSTLAPSSGDWVPRAEFDRLAAEFAQFRASMLTRLEKLEKR